MSVYRQQVLHKLLTNGKVSALDIFTPITLKPPTSSTSLMLINCIRLKQSHALHRDLPQWNTAAGYINKTFGLLIFLSGQGSFTGTADPILNIFSTMTISGKWIHTTPRSLACVPTGMAVSKNMSNNALKFETSQ
jgi:hypothetical protein